MDEEDTSVRDGRPTVIGLISTEGQLLCFDLYTRHGKLSHRRLRQPRGHQCLLRCLRYSR
jgi:hypothetical protein